ncbi:MAG: hypothetical protein ACR2H3_15885 [Acidimicrobiales bacterium]
MPTASPHSVSSHPGRASSAARVTTSSGASSTTSVAGSSWPSTSFWASRSFRGNDAVYLRAATVADQARRVPTYDPLADGRFKGCPNGRRLWPYWLIRAATGNVRDGKGRRIYPGEDRWIGLIVSKAPPIGEPDDGVDPGDPDGGTPDLPDVTELLEVIADAAGELEDHIEGLKVSLDTLRPYLPAASDSRSEPGDGVSP